MSLTYDFTPEPATGRLAAVMLNSTHPEVLSADRLASATIRAQ